MHLVAVLLPLLLLLPRLLHATPPLTMATADGIPLSTPMSTGFHDQVVREACKRIGRQMETIHLPAERALVNADEGIEDGVYVRVHGLETLYKNLRIVPEKITDYEFVAFGKNPDMQITNWDSLQEHDVAIVTGWKILETKIVRFKSLIKVKNGELLFKALAEDKVDLVVFNKLDGYGVIKDLNLKDIHALKMPLATREMFLYLHKNHEDLVPQLTDALRSMKSDGSYAAIKSSTLAPYLPAEAREQ